MKKALTVLAILLLPLSIMAMTPVSDETLSDVTGQAGVNINADITMDITIGTLAWGDATGLDLPWDPAGSDEGGYIGVKGFNITNMNIKARLADNYGGFDPATMLKPITIDVATNPALYGGNTFVRFGLGSLVISMDGLTQTVGLGPDTSIAQTLGVFSTGDMAVYINPGSYVDTYANGGCGLAMKMNVIIDELQIGYVSWGDTDGFTDETWITASGAGYVGLGNLTLAGPITTVGSVAIDVATATEGAYVHAAGHNVTVVHISFPDEDLELTMGAMTADVVLAGNADLSSTPGVLGTIYNSGVNLTIRQGGWLDIWAH